MNPYSIDGTSSTTIAATFAKLGVKAPAKFTAAHDRLTLAAAALRNRPAPGADDLPVAVLAALENGVDPAADPEVQRVIAAASLAGHHGLEASASAILIENLRTVCTEHHPAIVAVWTPPFTKAAARLAAAHAVLGPVDLDDTTAIVARGAEAATAWGEARAAIEVIDTIVGGWIALHSFVTGTTPNKQHRLNVIANVDASVWIDAELDHSEPDAWFALNKGYSLAICPVQDFARRIAAIEGELRQRTDADNRRAHDAATGRIVNV